MDEGKHSYPALWNLVDGDGSGAQVPGQQENCYLTTRVLPTPEALYRERNNAASEMGADAGVPALTLAPHNRMTVRIRIVHLTEDLTSVEEPIPRGNCSKMCRIMGSWYYGSTTYLPGTDVPFAGSDVDMHCRGVVSVYPYFTSGTNHMV